MPQESLDASKADKNVPILPTSPRTTPAATHAGHSAEKLNQTVDFLCWPRTLNHMVDLAERRLSHVFEALSDPGRRWIVKRLAQPSSTPCTPSDFTRPLHMSLQGVTKHIAVLERAGIVRREKRGRQRILSLDGAALHAANAWIEHYRAFWESKLDALAAHVTAPAQTPHALGPSRSPLAPSRKDSAS